MQGRRGGSGLRVQLYDVGAKRRIESRDFSVVNVPPVRDTEIRDSVMVSTTTCCRLLTFEGRIPVASASSTLSALGLPSPSCKAIGTEVTSKNFARGPGH